MGILGPSTVRNMDIVLDGDNTPDISPRPVHTYTTYDDVRGHVALSTLIPTSFSGIEISLLGTARTTHPDHIAPVIATPGATHVFLRLTMPMPPSTYPPPSSSDDSGANTYTLNPGTPLLIPFHFVIPSSLLPTACSHDLESSPVKDAHCLLPPSLGGFLLPRDDLSPEMANITYAIHAKLLSPVPASGFPTPLLSSLRKIHVTPATPESPPLRINPGDSNYRLTRTKSLSRGMFKGKLGTLTLSTPQPRAFQLSPSSSCPPTTLTTLTARFDPETPSSSPPRLGALTAKIRATTTHSIRPARGIPDHDSRSSAYEIHAGAYTTAVPLPSHDVAAVPWTLHVPAPAYARRDSGYSTAESDSLPLVANPSPHNQENKNSTNKGAYYTATIPLPLSLPGSKAWIPTFHSCLTSRFYTLVLELSVHPPGAMPSSKMALKVPVQIAGVLGSVRAEVTASAREEEEALAREGFWEGGGPLWNLGQGGPPGQGEGDGLPGYVAPVRRRRR